MKCGILRLPDLSNACAQLPGSRIRVIPGGDEKGVVYNTGILRLPGDKSMRFGPDQGILRLPGPDSLAPEFVERPRDPAS